MTALIQSASATTVLTVGLVNSALIEFAKAIGLLIGANLGTTATAWLLSLNSIGGKSLLLTIIKPSSFSPFLAIAGVVLTMFCKSKKKHDIGSTLLGFAIMMIGMNMMSQAVAPLKEIPAITNLLMSFTNPILGFLFACAFAMLVQSSDAVIGILQAFALTVGVTYGMAIPLICGAQVGTCITALISSLGTSNNGKRTALMNLYYNLLKVIPFMIIFYILNHFISFVFMDESVGGIGIPVAHTLINIFGTAIWLPLSNVIVRLAQRTIRLSEQEKEEAANTLTILDENLLVTPGIAIEQADKAVMLLTETVGEAFGKAAAIMDDPEVTAQIRMLCERSRRYQEQIDAYLLRISSRELGQRESSTVSLLAAASPAFGRMGKLAKRILDLIQKLYNSSDQLTEDDIREFRIIGYAVTEVMQLTFQGFAARRPTLSVTIRYYTEEVTELSQIDKRRFIQRIHEGGRLRSENTLYTDICYAEEKLIDYCDLVADALIRYGRENGEEARSGSPEMTQKQVHEIFRDKFEMLEQ